jgi:hypothetical protein
MSTFKIRTICPEKDSPYYDDRQGLNNFSGNGGMFRKDHNNYTYECGNCTTYAYGRAWEIMDEVSGHNETNLGSEPPVTLSGNAQDWYKNCNAEQPTDIDRLLKLESNTNVDTWYRLPTINNPNFRDGTDIRGTPRQGCIGVIAQGTFGHVFIVEKILSTSELTGDMTLGISHSGYSSTPAWAFEFKYHEKAYWDREAATITLGSPFAGSRQVVGFIYLPGVVGNAQASGEFIKSESSPIIIYSSSKEPKYYIPQFYSSVEDSWKIASPRIYRGGNWEKLFMDTSESNS